jgi:hypothetical protein
MKKKKKATNDVIFLRIPNNSNNLYNIHIIKERNLIFILKLSFIYIYIIIYLYLFIYFYLYINTKYFVEIAYI